MRSLQPGPAPPPSDPQRARIAVVMFELIGRGPAQIVGPVSARRYYFGRTGDRLQVDPRDRAGLVTRSDLRWIR